MYVSSKFVNKKIKHHDQDFLIMDVRDDDRVGGHIPKFWWIPDTWSKYQK